MTRWCRACGQDCPASTFTVRAAACRPCMAYRKKLRMIFDPQFAERQKEATRRWASGNKMWIKAYHRERKYQLTQAGYDALLVSQNGVCAICGDPPKLGEELVVDHDHSCCPSFRDNGGRGCGRCVRGLLHQNCNKLEGMVTDQILEGLTRYRTVFAGGARH